MSTCTLTGTFLDPTETAISGATVRFNIASPCLDASATKVISPKETTTTTASNGTWSLTLSQGASGTITLDCPPDSVNSIKRYTFAINVPQSASASFVSAWADPTNAASFTPPFSFSQISGSLATAQLPALLSAEIWVGNASNAATVVAVSGDATLSNAGALSVVSVGTSSAANIHSAELAANAATSSNTNSTIVKRDGSGNFSAGTITAALIGNVTGNASGTAANITGIAATANGGTGVNGSATFPSTGTVQATTPNNHGVLVSGAGATATVVAPNASTVFPLISGGASADPAWAALGATGGGTGLTTYTTGDVPYASATNTLSKLAIGTSGQFLKTINGIPGWGPGANGINYLSTNPDAETDTTGWTTYADAAGTSPVDGTGGAPTVTWTRTTSTPLRGTGSFLNTKDAANRQGNGVSFAITLDSADQAKPIMVSFDYAVASGTYADGDLTVYLYDVTNAVVIQPAPYQILSATAGLSQKWTGYFQTSAASTSYRLCIHTASTSASAYTVKFDNFNVGPTYQSYGAVETDWATYTPIFSASLNTPTSITSQWKRVGDTLHIRGVATSGGTPTGAAIKISLPTGFVANVAVNMVLKGNFQTAYTGGTFGGMVPLLLSADTSNIQVGLQNTASVFTPVNGNTVLSGATLFSWNAEVPITGWSSNVQVSSDADTRVVAATALSQVPTGTLNGSFNVTKFGTINKDTHAAYATGTGLYAVPVPGWYELNGTIETAATFAINQFTAIALYQNGSGVDYAYTPAGGSMARLNAPYNFLVYANAGDTLGIYTACNGTGPSYTATNSASSLHIKRVSGPAQIAASESVNASYFSTGSTTSTTTTPINYDSKVFDTHSAVTTGAAWKFTAPMPGKYTVNTFNNSASGTNASFLSIYKNGSVLLPISYTPNFSTNLLIGSATISLLQGDYIDLRCATSSVVSGNATQSNGAASRIEIVRVGN